jgi:hypothetical protein
MQVVSGQWNSLTVDSGFQFDIYGLTTTVKLFNRSTYHSKLASTLIALVASDQCLLTA